MLDSATGNSFQCFNTDTGAASPDAPTGKGKVVTPGQISCSGTVDTITNLPVCIFRAIAAGVASFLIYIGVTFLTACGLLFEFVLHYTVVSFKTPMYDAVSAAIVAAWGAFRDIANILIIGFFTFIAISTILGSHEYGAKKLLARVLIVAVLINFSLLFTKLIIDSSNFLAYQFYNASMSNIDQGGAQGAINASGQTIDVGGGTNKTKVAGAGIAGTFIRYLGVTGIADSYSKVREKQEEADNALFGLAFGVLAFIFLMAVGLVFLYGSFLLVSRAILFIILLITSSLAFATYLIPALSDNYGWKKWWKSLMSNALLAPVLMMMLWVTLTVSATLKDGLIKNGTLGDLASNTTSSANISALFSYLIILGLLFASFKLASSFSSGIMGFNFAALIPALGLAAGARVAAFAGRQTIGRGSLAASDALKKRGQNARDGSLAQTLYKFGSKGFKGVATSDMNAMRTLGSPIAKTTGLGLDTLAGKNVKGFEGSLKERAKGYAHDAEMLHVDSKKQGEITAQAIKDELGKNAALGERHAGASEALDVHQKALADATKAQASAVENMTKAMKDAQQKVDSAGSAVEKAAAEGEVKTVRKLGEDEMRKQSDRIKQAATDITNAKKTIGNIEGEARASAIANGNLKEYKSEKDLGITLAHNRYTNTLARVAGWNTEKNDRLAQLTGKEVGDHHERKEAKKIADYLKEKTGGDHDAHAAPKAAAPEAHVHKEAAPAAAHPPAGDSHSH